MLKIKSQVKTTSKSVLSQLYREVYLEADIHLVFEKQSVNNPRKEGKNFLITVRLGNYSDRIFTLYL